MFQQIVKDEVFLPLFYINQFDHSILNAVWNDVHESKEKVAKDVDTASVTYFSICQGICIGEQRKTEKNFSLYTYKNYINLELWLTPFFNFIILH
jgi:hypothetical protein